MPFLLPKEPRFQLDPELQEFLRRRYTETPARMPLPIPETVEGEGEGETLLEKLTGRITAEEEAALAGKATGPDTAQQYFGDASNIFLTAAGLPAQPVRTPARDERQSMRDWVMRRAQLAQGTETRAQAAERTKAYAASVEQQRLRDLERQAQAAEAAGRQEEALKFRQEMDRERLGLEKERLGLERQKAEAEAKRRAAGAGVVPKAAEEKAKRQAREDATTLRKEFNALPEVKSFSEAQTSFRKIESAAKDASAAGDLALIFAYMKVLDPGSTVREGEFANAQNAAGVPQQVINLYNRAASGERLNPAQRQDFLTSSRRLFDAQRMAYTEQRGRYRTLAERSGVNPDDVTGVEGKTEAPPAAPPGAAKQAAPAEPASGTVTLVDEAGEEFDVSATKADAIMKAKPGMRRK